MSKEEIMKFIFDFSNPKVLDAQIAFFMGVTFALAVIAIVIIVKIIFYLVFGCRKRASGIRISGEGGSLFVTSSALFDLIKSIERHYRSIVIRKSFVSHAGKKGRYAIELSIDFNRQGGELPSKEELRDRVLNELEKTFGINNVSEVHISVRKVISPASSSFTDNS